MSHRPTLLSFLFLSATLLFADLPLPNPDLSKMKGPIRDGISQLRDQVVAMQMEKGADDPEVLALYGRLGELFLGHSQLEDAAVVFEHLRGLQPDEKKYPYYLGIISEDQNRLQDAEAWFKTLLELDGTDVHAHSRLGHALLALNRAEEARDQFMRALTIAPDRPFLLDGLGRAAAALGDHQMAVDAFEKVLAVYPDASSVQYPLGLAYRRLGNREKAREHLGKRGEVPVPTQNPYNELLEKLVLISKLQVALDMSAEEPFNSRDFMGYIITNFSGRQGLINYFGEAAKDRLNSDSPNRKVEAARLYYAHGNIQVRERQNLDGAMTAYKQAIDLAPDFIDPYLELGFVYRRNGRFDDAVSIYNLALEQQPGSWDALLDRGRAFKALRKFPEAAKDLDAVLAERPESHSALLERATLHSALFELDPGIAAFRKLLALDPPVEVRVQALNGLGLLLQDKGAQEEAVQIYQQSLQLQGEQLTVRLNLATAYALLGRMDEALPAYRAVLEEDPVNEPAWLGGVAALVMTGRLDEGLAAMVAAYQAIPNNPRLTHLLGRMLAAHPKQELRNGAQAVNILQPLLQGDMDVNVAETYAMALAQAGRFEEAVAIQKDLVTYAEQSNAAQAAARLKANLAVFEAGQPCCDPTVSVNFLP